MSERERERERVREREREKERERKERGKKEKKAKKAQTIRQQDKKKKTKISLARSHCGGKMKANGLLILKIFFFFSAFFSVFLPFIVSWRLPQLLITYFFPFLSFTSRSKKERERKKEKRT